MLAWDEFERLSTNAERRTIARLATPEKLQAFLNDLPYRSEEIYRSPLRVLRDGRGHCYDGAVLAAMALSRMGHPPRIVELLPNKRDDDHIIAVYRREGRWGAVAHSNFSGLRYREPVFLNLRELVMSYFEEFYNLAREKTLRGYTLPLRLAAFDSRRWMTRDAAMTEIARRLDTVPRRRLLTRGMVLNLAAVDARSYRAGLLGSVQSGLFKPHEHGKRRSG
ncbi:MAG: hypothetical protein JW748_14480 [Anaerolineales bacterium]|nr:hypothetical protein [Anaerolineales bacterium]